LKRSCYGEIDIHSLLACALIIPNLFPFDAVLFGWEINMFT